MRGVGNHERSVVSPDPHVHDWQPGEVILGDGGELVEVCADGSCGEVAWVRADRGAREPLPDPHG